MTPLVMVVIVAVVVFAPLALMALDMLLERDTARRERVANRQVQSAWIQAYTVYVENCTRHRADPPRCRARSERRDGEKTLAILEVCTTT